MSGTVVGVVLAAGEGSRIGMPKALIVGPDGMPWAARTADALSSGGVERVYVVVGAGADEIRPALPSFVRVVEADDWREGMGASLRAGLTAIADHESSADAAIVLLVDTPGVGVDAVRAIAAYAAPDVVVRATYRGTPGHPVLFGREHWRGVLESARGDQGAREYIARHGCIEVELGDSAAGDDIDTLAALDAWRARPGGEE
jgi:CTP:molybdopterin cytidylyltransferase MocA